MIPVLALLLMQAASAPADYAVHEVFKGAIKSPKFATPGQKTFRKVILDQVAHGPNFAGHYTLAQWGCGAGCVQLAVVDLKTGEIFEPPFGKLPKATICLEGTADDPGIVFEKQSSLLVLKGCPEFKDCGVYYYQWTGAEFKLLRKDLLTRLTYCQP